MWFANRPCRSMHATFLVVYLAEITCSTQVYEFGCVFESLSVYSKPPGFDGERDSLLKTLDKGQHKIGWSNTCGGRSAGNTSLPKLLMEASFSKVTRIRMQGNSSARKQWPAFFRDHLRRNFSDGAR